MPVRILQGLTQGQVGGTELMVLQLLAHLARDRFTCEVSMLDGHGPMSDRFTEIGIPTHDLSGRGGYVSAWWRLVQLLRRGRFQIVHFYGFRTSLLGRLAAPLARPRPVVVHGIRGLHITEGEEISSLRTRLALGIERRGAGLVDAYIANSESAVAFLTSQGLPPSKLRAIPNGIEPPDEVARTESPGLRVTELLCVANFRPRKRHGDLIEALALLHGRGVRVRCRLVGDGVTRSAVQTLVKRRGLGELVEFLGSQTPREVSTLLRTADIFVLPSLWEGMPVSVMEAMGAALPVVGTDVPGIRDLVVDGVTGSLAAVRDPPALADRLERLVTDVRLRTRMGAAGRTRIRAEFSLERMVQRYEAAYAELAETRWPTPPARGSR